MVSYNLNLNNINQTLNECGSINTLMRLYFLVSINCAKFENDFFKRGIKDENLVEIIKHSPGSFAEFCDVMSRIGGNNKLKILEDNSNNALQNASFKFAEFCCLDQSGVCNSAQNKKACELAKNIIENSKTISGRQILYYSVILDSMCAIFYYQNKEFSGKNLKAFNNFLVSEGVDVFTRHSFKRNPRIQRLSVYEEEVRVVDESLPKDFQEMFADYQMKTFKSGSEHSGRVDVLNIKNKLGEENVERIAKDVSKNLLCALNILEDKQKNK